MARGTISAAEAAAVPGPDAATGAEADAGTVTAGTADTVVPAGEGRTRREVWPTAVLVGAFAVSRIIGAAAGVRFDDGVLRGTRLTDKWQLLDVHLLRTDLLGSVWHLDSQPPLYNLYSGLVLALPGGWQRPAEASCGLVLGLVIVLCTYRLLLELAVPWGVALSVTLVGVVASPAYLLFENWLDYAEPTAALGTFAAWCLVRYLRTGRARFGMGFFGGYAAIVLLDSTYQIEWLLVGVVVVLVVLRHRWRQVLATAAVPLLLVGTWYVKDAVLFGTSTTSSWLGMNVARSVLFEAPPDSVARLERQGTLTPLASVPAFGPPSAYIPRFVHPTRQSDQALGALFKADGATNFNNPIYITVSSRYLHDDLAYITARPGDYLGDIGAAIQVWLVPSDQNFTNSQDWPAVRGYAAVYDRVVEWQPVTDPAAAEVVFDHRPSPLSWLSLQAVAVYSLSLLGIPVLIWRRRRVPATAGTLTVLWWTTAYAFAASSLVELGENERFRFELGSVPLVLATVVVVAVVRAGWARWPARRRGARLSAGTGPPGR